MRIVVLGAGYAGLTLARRLERKLRADADVVLINDTEDHLVQHELHRVVRKPEMVEEITVPIEDALDATEFRRAVVAGVDRQERKIELESGERIDYDLAAICLGAATATYDLPGIEEYGTPLKRLPDAARIREDFLELASNTRVVVGGAGLSGIQIAGELAALADEQGKAIEVRLLEQTPHVAPNFPEAFREAVAEELSERGVEIQTGSEIERATDSAIELGEESIEYDQFVWTGGLRGPDALGGERPVTDATLRLDEHTFAVGDSARVVDSEGAAVPASAAAAVREAHTVGDNIVRIAEHEGGIERYPGKGRKKSGSDAVFGPRIEPFRFDAPGWLVSVGDGAVAQVGSSVFRGRTAKALKTTVGAGYLGTVGAFGNAADLARNEIFGD